VETREIINSGILETYAMGIATEEEVEQVLFYKKRYPEVSEALNQVELELERFAMKHGIEPPAGVLAKIEDEIRDIQLRNREVRKPREQSEDRYEEAAPKNPYIEVESQSSHMRIHKNWRWVFAAVFILGKIFLGTAIYFYLESRQAQQQVEKLKLEIKTIKNR
jgi:hypothetical protein